MTSDEVFTAQGLDQGQGKNSCGRTGCGRTKIFEIHATWTDHRPDDNCTGIRYHIDWQAPV